MYTNVAGSRIVAKAFLTDMITQGKGQVCLFGSLGGLIATYGYSAYSASKFAVVGMAGALRQELYSSGVGVSVLCPPEVDTPMVAKEASHILPETRFVKDIGGLLNTTTVTKAAIKGINKNQFIIVPGFKGKMSYILARYMPNIFAWAIQKLVGLAGKFIK
jgi:short-subunit dehydrogenase